jgi:hypothetical protein
MIMTASPYRKMNARRLLSAVTVRTEERVMSVEWELLTIRGLAATDEHAQEFLGTLVIHRAGSPEPVESITIRVKRSVLDEMHGAIGRLLTRSVGLKR